MIDAFFVWSGGKDSVLALHRVIQQKQYTVKYLITTVTEQLQRITMHGVRVELLEMQARSLGIPLLQVLVPENADMADYDKRMAEAFTRLKADGIETAIFGDIFLADLRAYRENKLADLGMKAVFPLWQADTTVLVQEFEQLQFKALLVCVNNGKLGQNFIGRELNTQLLSDLPPNVDPCGENGEYHSFVYDGPLFQLPVLFEKGEVVFRDYAANQEKEAKINYDAQFWFLDLLPLKYKIVS